MPRCTGAAGHWREASAPIMPVPIATTASFRFGRSAASRPWMRASLMRASRRAGRWPGRACPSLSRICWGRGRPGCGPTRATRPASAMTRSMRRFGADSCRCSCASHGRSWPKGQPGRPVPECLACAHSCVGRCQCRDGRGDGKGPRRDGGPQRARRLT